MVLAKDLKDQFIGIKTKKESKHATNEYRYFLKSNFVGVNRLFVLVYTNYNAIAKRFNARQILFRKKHNQKL